MSVWKDFSSAEDQQSYDVIPKGTVARVRMTIKPGGYNDPDQGWTGGYATLGDSGAVYLSCEFVITEGPFARRKVWSLIGLHSPKGPTYANMGRSFVKGILNSARGFSAKDDSPQAMAARRISGIGDLDGIEFIARIDIEKDRNGDDKNVIKTAVTKDSKDAGKDGGGSTPPTAQPPSAAASAPAANLPSWAR
jgi:hypothetical protein